MQMVYSVMQDTDFTKAFFSFRMSCSFTLQAEM